MSIWGHWLSCPTYKLLQSMRECAILKITFIQQVKQKVAIPFQVIFREPYWTLKENKIEATFYWIGLDWPSGPPTYCAHLEGSGIVSTSYIGFSSLAQGGILVPDGSQWGRGLTAYAPASVWLRPLETRCLSGLVVPSPTGRREGQAFLPFCA